MSSSHRIGTGSTPVVGAKYPISYRPVQPVRMWPLAYNGKAPVSDFDTRTVTLPYSKNAWPRRRCPWLLLLRADAEGSDVNYCQCLEQRESSKREAHSPLSASTTTAADGRWNLKHKNDQCVNPFRAIQSLGSTEMVATMVSALHLSGGSIPLLPNSSGGHLSG